ncbi:MAG: hypothetical protein P8104_09585, partial [Gammaproteobacteria bacterium]
MFWFARVIFSACCVEYFQLSIFYSNQKGCDAMKISMKTVCFSALVAVVSVPLASVANAELCGGQAVTIYAVPGQVTVGTPGPDVIFGTTGPDVI